MTLARGGISMYRSRHSPAITEIPDSLMLARLTLPAVLASLGAAHLARAQGATPAVPVHGIAFDSLRGAPLADALVMIVGTDRSTVTDAHGRFQFASVPAGPHTFAVQHAALDSIGVSGISARATVTDGRDEVRIALPSFATLWRAACGNTPPPRDSGFVYGTVRDATGQDPLPDAIIEVTWIDVVVDKSLAMTRTRWRERARADASGSYGACGVPLSVGLRVQASSDSGRSGLIDLMPSGLRVQRRDLLVGHASDSGATRGGTITGLVTDTAGRPFPEARVIMDGAPEIRSGADGRFTFRNVPSGTRQVEVLALGMLPVTAVVDVVAHETAAVAATLRKVRTLDVVRVTASRRVQLTIRDFEERRKTGFGYVRDSTAIASRGTLSSVFSEFAGVQVERGTSGAGSFSLSMKASGPGRCTPNLWIDGREERDFDFLNSFHTDELAAVEVYPQAFSVPMRFMGRNSTCGAVVVWTKWSFG